MTALRVLDVCIGGLGLTMIAVAVVSWWRERREGR